MLAVNLLMNRAGKTPGDVAKTFEVKSTEQVHDRAQGYNNY